MMSLTALAFYVFAGITVLAAFMVIAARNPVHSVLYLILAFFNAAALFLLLGAEFLAMILLIVYVGAVAVLFLFVVMMLDVSSVRLREGVLQHLPVGATIGIVLLIEILFVVTTSHLGGDLLAPVVGAVSNTESLGAVLYTQYFYAFQAAGMVLLVAMIGAIVLTHRRREGVKRQNISEQVRRTPADSIEIRKIKSGEGI